MARRTRPETPASCDCQTVTHRHGTDTMYLTHKCGCPPCRGAHTAERRKYRATAYQNGEWVPVGALAEHINYLNRRHGYKMQEIADLAGVSVNTVRRIRNGLQDQVLTITRDAIMGVRPKRAPGGYLDATGARRRLQALSAAGWSMKQVEAPSGVDATILHKIRRGANARVSTTTFNRVKKAYDALSMSRPAPATLDDQRTMNRTLNHAQTQGWLPPLAWDDDRIDDPAYTPNVTPLRPNRDEWIANRFDDLEHLLDSGVPVHEAVKRAGYPNIKAAYSATTHKGFDRLASILNEGMAYEREAA